MIDLKGILFSNIEAALRKTDHKIDELNIDIDLTNHNGNIIGYFLDKIQFKSEIERGDLSTIQKIFINKVITMYNKDFPENKVNRIFLSILINDKEYKIYLFIDGFELPIQFEF